MENSPSPIVVPNLNKSTIVIVLLFSCLGNIVVQITKYFPSGFYFSFLKENNLDENIGRPIILPYYINI